MGHHSICGRCPFPPDGPWENGSRVRSAIYTASTSLVGTTGSLGMVAGDGYGGGAVADGREASSVTYCAVNLRPHAVLGGRFESLSTLDGGELGIDNTSNDTFQVK